VKPVVLDLDSDGSAGQRLAAALDAEPGTLSMRRFPDGETYLRIHTPLDGRTVIVLASLHHPDDKFLAIHFAAATARELGAKQIGLVAPYLAYMRQDARFNPGEAVTSRAFARLISASFDWLVTVDPHLHRHRALHEIYRIPAVALHAAPLVAAWIAREVPRPLLIGPDSESEQWVAAVAAQAGAPHVLLTKVRLGDHSVKVSAPEVSKWRDHTPVLVDDMISTAHTMMETVNHLTQAGLAAPVCVAVHGLFAASAYPDLLAAGARRVITCNTVPHPSNAIDVLPLLAEGVRQAAVLR